MSLVKDSVREATAGALAGAVTKTLSAPLDRLKLVVQLRGSLKSRRATYTGPVSALRQIVRQEGFWALWRGNVPTLLINCGTIALNFVLMDWYKKAATVVVVVVTAAGSSDNNHAAAAAATAATKSLVSGFLAGGTAITILYLIGVLRTKLALDMGKRTVRQYPAGMRDVIRQSIRVNGWTSLYQGYAVALLSVSLYRMVHLGGYDYIKTVLLANKRHQIHDDLKEKNITTKDTQIPLLERFVAAQAVSMLASTVHYPADSVRRRLMMQADHTHKQYKSGWHCFVTIYQQEGLGGYFRGLGTNYVRSMSAALLLISYDFFKDLMS